MQFISLMDIIQYINLDSSYVKVKINRLTVNYQNGGVLKLAFKHQISVKLNCRLKKDGRCS